MSSERHCGVLQCPDNVNGYCKIYSYGDFCGRIEEHTKKTRKCDYADVELSSEQWDLVIHGLCMVQRNDGDFKSLAAITINCIREQYNEKGN